jgi:type IV secretory pathway VirB2 component (pilin)
MNRFKTIAGVLCLVLGLIWTLQGANLMGGSFMTGQTQWLVIGIVVALVGIVLLASTRRRT